jgi:hypothetical protein
MDESGRNIASSGWSRIGLRRQMSLTLKKRDLTMEEMRSDRDRLESNRTTRFQADVTGDNVTEGVIEREGFSIFGKLFGKTYK